MDSSKFVLVKARSKLGVVIGIGAVLAIATALRLGTGDEPPTETEARQIEAREPPPRSPAPPRRPAPTPAPLELQPSSAPAQRDHTGELIADGPARELSLPERDEQALDNVPAPAQTEAALVRVLERIDAEIAAARAAGDDAEVARLEVRRARLEHKLDEPPADDAEPR